MNNNEITKRVNHRKYGYKKQVQDIAKARFNEMKAYINEEDKILDRALEMAERIENKIKVRTSEQEWKTVSQLASKLDDLNSEIRKHYNYFEKVRIFANKINSIKLEELSVNEIADLLEEYYELTKGSNKNFENNVKKIKVKVKPATLAEVSKKKIIPKIKNVRVANVIDSTNDDDLELENQITEIEKLVKEAEETVTEESILKAKEALSKLEDQSIKNEFFNRLIKVREKLLRELIEAENSFRNAKYSLDNDEILEASDKINALKDSNKKESLVKELISFKQKIDMLNEMLVSLRQKMIWKKEPITELEMRELEKCYNEVSINDENEYFGLVQDIKNYYNKEKNKASTPMPEQENNQSEYENQILKVEKLVKEAEEKMDKESISKAKEAVFKLEDQTIKNEFFNRLDDINIKLLDELNEAKKAFEEAKKTLNEDRILAASNKINALRDSEDKASLVKEIDTFKEKIVAFADILEELKKKKSEEKTITEAEIEKLGNYYNEVAIDNSNECYKIIEEIKDYYYACKSDIDTFEKNFEEAKVEIEEHYLDEEYISSIVEDYTKMPSDTRQKYLSKLNNLILQYNYDIQTKNSSDKYNNKKVKINTNVIKWVQIIGARYAGKIYSKVLYKKENSKKASEENNIAKIYKLKDKIANIDRFKSEKLDSVAKSRIEALKPKLYKTFDAQEFSKKKQNKYYSAVNQLKSSYIWDDVKNMLDNNQSFDKNEFNEIINKLYSSLAVDFSEEKKTIITDFLRKSKILKNINLNEFMTYLDELDSIYYYFEKHEDIVYDYQDCDTEDLVNSYNYVDRNREVSALKKRL